MAIFKIGDVVQGDVASLRCMTVVGVMSDGYVTCSHSEDGDIRDTIWHESLLRIANYPDGNVSHWRKFSAGVELGSRPADLDAAQAEIERLIVELAAMKCSALELKATIAERDHWRNKACNLERRLTDAENEIAALRDVGRIAAHQPPASQRQAANPAPAADSVAVPDQARAAGADEVLSDFWGCPVGEALPVGVHYAWVLPQIDGKKAIVARQPPDDLTIPPVPFNALRWSR